MMIGANERVGRILLMKKKPAVAIVDVSKAVAIVDVSNGLEKTPLTTCASSEQQIHRRASAGRLLVE